MTSPVEDPHAGARVLTRGVAAEDATLGLILLHGRGAPASDILHLGELIAPPGSYVVGPQAVGHAWYPAGFMAPLEANRPWLDSALSLVERLVVELEGDGLDRSRIALGGFSQGACLALEFAARRTGRWAAVIAYSGGLIGPPGTALVKGGSLAGTPVLMGCSDMDPHIPLERVHDTATALEEMEARVDERIYPGMGHTVNDDEVAAGRELLASAATATTRE
ncbi:MAG: dienelactone hydrolase family protein [Gemmatimonadota bacterium]|nr:dienelactone hydrolase family protein [Gemmatimonadota bacterium]